MYAIPTIQHELSPWLHLRTQFPTLNVEIVFVE